MNKQQLYTFGGALLASTALSGAANAITIGKFTNNGGALAETFTTTPITIANSVFSTTAATANAVTMTPGTVSFGAKFSNNYNTSSLGGSAKFSVEFIPAGAQFTGSTVALANAKFVVLGTGGATFAGTIGAGSLCTGFLGFGTQFVLDSCTTGTTTGNAANQSANIGAVHFSGVTFTNASGLATAGSSVTLTGRVYNTSTLANFEAASTGTIITSAVPTAISVAAAATVTASAISTPLAFTSLSATNGANATSTMDLVSVNITTTGTYGGAAGALSTLTVMADVLSSARITVTSSILSSGAVAQLQLHNGALLTTVATTANFTGGSITFAVAVASFDTEGSLMVKAVFGGSVAIPSAAAGTVSVLFGGTNATVQVPATVTGATATVGQGGFRAEVNTFNASTNGPYSSYLRIHNNGSVAGTVTISIRNDDHTSGAVLGSSFTTAAIQPGSTMQLSAAEMEDTATSTKLPAGGANVPSASRFGSYTVSVTGPIVGYVQHILFDGSSVADLSAFRNSGVTANNAAP